MFGEIFSIVDTAVTAFGGNEASKNAKKYADAQAAEAKRVAEANAKLSRRDASIAEKRAAQQQVVTGWEVAKQYKDLSAFIGQQTLGFAARGVVVGTGSALDVQARSYRDGMQDLEQIKYNGKMKERNYIDLRDKSLVAAENGLRDGAAAASLAQLEGSINSQNIMWGTVGKMTSSLVTSAYRFGYL